MYIHIYLLQRVENIHVWKETPDIKIINSLVLQRAIGYDIKTSDELGNTGRYRICSFCDWLIYY